LALNSGETASAELTFALPDAFKGQLCNTGSVGSVTPDPDTSDNTSQYCGRTVAPPATDVGVSVTPGAGKVYKGDVATFTAVVGNNGPADTTGTVVTFTLPPEIADPQVVLTSHTTGLNPSPTCTTSGNTVTCVIGDLPNGANVVYEISGPTKNGVVGDEVALIANVVHDHIDTDADNDSAKAAIQLIQKPDNPSPTPKPSPTPNPPPGPPPGPLPFTGADPQIPALLSLFLLLAGVSLAAVRRRVR
jgi:uncharacterized repeat protein (TIGR01451 family)